MSAATALAGIWIASACACGDGAGAGASQAAAEPAPAEAPKAPAPDAPPARAEPGAKALVGALEAYLDLQEKLAADDATGARSAFATLGKRLAEAGDVPSTLREPLNAAAQKGAATAEQAAQRQIFDGLSETVIGALTQLGNPLPGAIHVAHCPMAFDNRGARWVQRTDAIKNPYFGSTMPTCGAIDATVASGHKLASGTK